MVSRLFWLLESNLEDSVNQSHSSKHTSFKESNFPYFCDCIRRIVPKIFVKFCCPPNRREIAMQMAREKLDREVNIIEIIKSWRYYERSLRFLLGERRKFDFKEKSRYHSINPERRKQKAFKDVKLHS